MKKNQILQAKLDLSQVHVKCWRNDTKTNIIENHKSFSQIVDPLLLEMKKPLGINT